MAIDDNTSYELTGAQVKDLANKIKAKAADNTFVGATSAIPGSKGLVPAPQAGDDTKFLSGDGTWQTVSSGATYTAGTGIDITSNVISATNTGIARALTTNDYNWNSVSGDDTTLPFDCVAIWKLPEGFYTNTNGVNFKRTKTIPINTDSGYAWIIGTPYNNYRRVIEWSYATEDTVNIWRVAPTGTGSNKSKVLLQETVVNNLTTNSTNTPLSAAQGKTLKDLVDSLITKAAGAPTTSTAGTVGKLYEDTTNGKLYICTDDTGGVYTWTEVGSGGGGSYTAGAHIDITGTTISAIDYISADSPTAAVSPSSPVTTPMIADGAVTSAKIATGVVPQITMTNVDPGEGTPLADNNFIAVYDTTGSLLDMFYPVGSYYETSNTSFNPNTAWGGTWVEDSAGRVLVAKDSGTFTTVGDTGGEETHTLILNEIPSHGHEISRYNNTEGFSTAYGNPCSGWCLRSNLTGGQNDILTTNKGGGLAHNNLQPYVVVKRWHRTA